MDQTRLRELETLLSSALSGITGLLHPNREHPPTAEEVERLERDVLLRIRRLRAFLDRP